MKTILIIVGDCNDADYITEITYDPSPEILDLVRKVAPFLSERRNSNWNNMPSDYRSKNELPYDDMYEGILTNEEIETFNSFVPKGEYGIHTIVEIVIINVNSTEQLL